MSIGTARLGLSGFPISAAAAWGSDWPADQTRLLSARGDGAGGYWLTGLDPRGHLTFDRPLPGRGHGIAVHPGGHEAACLARRPGDFLLVLGLPGGEPLALRHTPEDRHCQGHGVYSADGSLLYTTENPVEGGAGRIGVWDVDAGYQRLGELPSHGIDPHELLLSSDGEGLIVANGGILTRPETGRAKLNLDTMKPSMVHLDRHDGRLIAEHRLPPELHRLSIRHLALGRDGTLCVALQYEGPADEHPPLVAFQPPGQGLRLAEAPAEVRDQIWAAMRNYAGSVAADPSGDWFAVSAPRGNLVTFWDAGGSFRGSTSVADGCGLAPGDDAGSVYLTCGLGALHHHDCRSGATRRFTSPQTGTLQWDNHLRRCA